MKFEQKILIQGMIIKNIHEYFLNKGFLPLNNPKLVPFRDDEEDHLIKVYIKGRENENIYLSRTDQIYKEIAALLIPQGKVYEVGPVFRGESISRGRRSHEFIGLDVEIRTNNLEDVIRILTDYILSIKDDEKLIKQLKKIKNHINLPDRIITVTYSQAQEILNCEKIGPKEEKKLSKLLREENNENVWILLTQFPIEGRIFYQINSKGYSDSFDLIANWEICSGGMRRMDLQEYMKALSKIGWSTKELERYVEIKSKFQVNTGGFGMGIERLIGSLINEEKILNIQPYPRIPGKKITF